MTTARSQENVVVTEKTCLSCHQSLPVEDFHRKGSYWDSRCKPCALSHKKNQYILKKQPKRNCYKNIVIRPYALDASAARAEFFSLLESFLIEECAHEQRIGA